MELFHAFTLSHLNALNEAPILVLHLLLARFGLLQPVDLVLQALDVLHRRLENGALVRPDVAHHLVVRVVVLRQQRAQLLDAIVDVEAAPAFDWIPGVRMTIMVWFGHVIWDGFICGDRHVANV